MEQRMPSPNMSHVVMPQVIHFSIYFHQMYYIPIYNKIMMENDTFCNMKLFF